MYRLMRAILPSLAVVVSVGTGFSALASNVSYPPPQDGQAYTYCVGEWRCPTTAVWFDSDYNSKDYLGANRMCAESRFKYYKIFRTDAGSGGNAGYSFGWVTCSSRKLRCRGDENRLQCWAHRTS